MAELTINTDDITAALAQEPRRASRPTWSPPRSAACSRSATASPPSAGLPDCRGERDCSSSRTAPSASPSTSTRSRSAPWSSATSTGIEEGQTVQGHRRDPLGARAVTACSAGSSTPSASPVDGKGPLTNVEHPPHGGPGARHHRPQAGARAAADRHQGHRLHDRRSAVVSAS